MILSVSCVSFNIESPSGFVDYKKERGWHRSIAPEGVRLRAKLIKDESQGNAEMWRISTEYHLKKMGYIPVNTIKILSASGDEGSHIEYEARYFGRDFIYTATIFVKGPHLAVIETTGEKHFYEKYRAEILKSIKSFSFK